MKPFEGTVNGKIHLAGLLTTLEGKKNGDIVIQSDVGSFKTLLGTVNQFYTMKELPKVDGKLALSMVVDKNSDVSLELSSPQVIVHADRKTDHILDDVDVVLSKKEDTIELRSYQLTYNKMLFYATKPSNIAFKENRVEIPQLWLNDQLKISGGVDLKQMKGEISANAETFHFTHEMIDLDSKIDIVAVLDGNRTDVKGKVTILGGDIHYDLGTKSFPSDSDIVIVQEMKKKEPSPFMDHLSLLINIDSKKPLVYKQGPVDMEANVEMGIHKAVYSDPMIIGSVDLVDGGSYTFEGKKFILDRSHVYLTGDPSKPMLDITVKYRSLRHLITINVTGTPAVPNILFSSVPSLTKEQILSIILFDSEEAAGKNDANAMMKMMGGAMAKSALNNLGVQIDHLVLGEGNSVEVGKKLTDNTTIIYINGEIPKMEVRYHYSPRIEVVVGASEQSESVDVVYRKDFNLKDDDIVIKGR
jgi:translocation and assembly module TamB